MNSGEVDCLVPKPQAGGSFAAKCNHHVLLALHLISQRDTRSHGQLRGNGGSRRDDVQGGVAAVSGCGAAFVWAGFAPIDVREHQRQRCSLHDVSNEIAVRRRDGIFRKQIQRSADFDRFLADGVEVVAGESTLTVQNTDTFLHRAALEHVRIEPAEQFRIEVAAGCFCDLWRALSHIRLVVFRSSFKLRAKQCKNGGHFAMHKRSPKKVHTPRERYHTMIPKHMENVWLLVRRPFACALRTGSGTNPERLAWSYQLICSSFQLAEKR